MNRPLRIAAIFLLLIFLGACRLFDVPLSGGATATPTAVDGDPTLPPTIPEGPSPTDGSTIVLVTRNFLEESASPRYEIDVEWPGLQWSGDPRVDAFNQAADAFAQEEIAIFKQGVESTPDDPAFQEFSSSLTVRYTPTYLDGGLFSVHLNVSFYMAGAAHPAHYSRSMTYDLREGRMLALEDLFRPGAAYLEAISAYCIEDLNARNTLAWEEGALPNAENYQVWNITPGGLQITFDAYQVAPYASGPQTVLIPYDRLREAINPEGPLAGLINQ